jgi:hypothetical protein
MSTDQAIALEMQYAYKRARKNFLESANSAFPIGSIIEWRHGSNIRSATVVMHSSYSERIGVTGKTGARYWIDLFAVLSYLQEKYAK